MRFTNALVFVFILWYSLVSFNLLMHVCFLLCQIFVSSVLNDWLGRIWLKLLILLS